MRVRDPALFFFQGLPSCSDHLLNIHSCSLTWPLFCCCCVTILSQTPCFNTAHTYYVTVSVGQEPGYSLAGLSESLKSKCQLKLQSYLRLDWGRIQFLAQVISKIHFLADSQIKGLIFLLAVDWRPVSVSCHVGPPYSLLFHQISKKEKDSSMMGAAIHTSGHFPFMD